MTAFIYYFLSNIFFVKCLTLSLHKYFVYEDKYTQKLFRLKYKKHE